MRYFLLGEAVIYTYWSSERFDIQKHDEEDCVAMGLGSYAGRWEDVSCTHKTFGHICQFGKPLLFAIFTHRYLSSLDKT